MFDAIGGESFDDLNKRFKRMHTQLHKFMTHVAKTVALKNCTGCRYMPSFAALRTVRRSGNAELQAPRCEADSISRHRGHQTEMGLPALRAPHWNEVCLGRRREPKATIGMEKPTAAGGRRVECQVA
jgi:hypothetical protein